MKIVNRSLSWKKNKSKNRDLIFLEILPSPSTHIKEVVSKEGTKG